MRAAWLALVLTIAAAAVPGADQRREKPTTHTVTIDATSFAPADLTIRRGDTVVWVNKDMIPHTATDTARDGFDSGAIAAGESWRRTFTTKADIDYICTFHPTMKGRLRVE